LFPFAVLTPNDFWLCGWKILNHEQFFAGFAIFYRINRRLSAD
jgi:hypothetical protein